MIKFKEIDKLFYRKKLSENDKIEFIIIFCTTPDITSAEVISKTLLNKKLASCITLLQNATSLYIWKGEIKQSHEVQLLIKSHVSLQNAIFNQIKSIHFYDIPELLVVPIIDGEQKFLSWINDSLQ